MVLSEENFAAADANAAAVEAVEKAGRADCAEVGGKTDSHESDSVAPTGLVVATDAAPTACADGLHSSAPTGLRQADATTGLRETEATTGLGEADAPAGLSETDMTQGNHGWTIVLLALGMGLIACCLLIPQADENRKLLYQSEKLKTDLEHLEKQVQINDEFVTRARTDPVLAERLAQRLMNQIRRGTNILDLKQVESLEDRSPYSLVTMPPPPPMPEYKPVGGRIAGMFRDAHNRLKLMGVGMALLAAGLILGQSTPKS